MCHHITSMWRRGSNPGFSAFEASTPPSEHSVFSQVNVMDVRSLQLCFVLFTVLFVFLHKLLLASMFQWPSLPPPLFSCIWTIFYISILLMTPPVLSVFYIFLFTLCIGNQKTACRCSPIIIKNSFQVQQRDALRQDFCLLAAGELECDTEPAATPKQKWTLLYGEC